MSPNSRRAAGLIVLALAGLWGCSRAPSGDPAQVEKLKTLETKLARLEDDFRAAASARDQLTKKLNATEEARAAAQTQADRLSRELKAKDELLKVREEQVTARTAERDRVTGQYQAFRDGLRELLAKGDDGKMDASPAVPATPAVGPKAEAPIIPIPPAPAR